MICTIFVYCRYSSRVFEICFNKLLKRRVPGEDAVLEMAARAASSSLPLLIQMGNITTEELMEEMTVSDQSGEQDI